MHDFKTYSGCVDGIEACRTSVNALVNSSQWFACMPLPDDRYEISVRVENKQRLDECLSRARNPF